ncbi:hypothetical protein ACUOA8_09325, partial [Escherichia sp. SS-MK2]
YDSNLALSGSLRVSLTKDSPKDPDSAKFESYFRDFGEDAGYVCGYVNAKNSYGAYTGKKPYYVRIEVKDRNFLISLTPFFRFAKG